MGRPTGTEAAVAGATIAGAEAVAIIAQAIMQSIDRSASPESGVGMVSQWPPAIAIWGWFGIASAAAIRPNGAASRAIRMRRRSRLTRSK